MDKLVRERDALRNELRDLRSVIAGMEETLDYRQKELEREEKKALKAERQLQDAHDHIFRLQPRRTDVTEAEAEEMFSDLFNNVQRWVANRLDKILEMLDQGQLKNRDIPHDAACRIISLTSARAIHNNGLDQMDEHHIIAMIMEFLRRSFFDQFFYCPLVVGSESNDITPVLNRIEQLMRAVPRDESQCRDWRVGALLALTLEEGFSERCINYEHLKTQELFKLLSPLVPTTGSQELGDSIKKSIVKPAMAMAHRLQLAATTYTFKWTSLNGNVSPPSIDLSTVVPMNIGENGKVIPLPGESSAMGPGVSQMRYLFDVAPGLYSKPPNKESTAKLNVVSKPRVLVHLGNGAPRTGATLLKWIDAQSKRDIQPRNAASRGPSIMNKLRK